MFSKIRKVDIELHDYCNRECDWCPRGVLERSSGAIFPEDEYIKVLTELNDNGFGDLNNPKTSPVLTFARYNEPLAFPELLIERIGIASDILSSKVRFEVNTNGDYLTSEILNRLHIDSLNIMDYDCRGREYWKERFSELGIMVIREAKHTITGMSATIKKIKVSLDWSQECSIENRGGLVDIQSLSNPKILNGARRTYPCIEPLLMISIEADGTMMPCYNMLSEAEEHEDYIVGNVFETSLVELFNSEKMKNIRRQIVSGDWQHFPEQCKYCNRIRTGYYAGIYHLESWSDKEKFKDGVVYLQEGDYIDA